MFLRLLQYLVPAAAEAKAKAVTAPGFDFYGIPPVIWPWVIFGLLLLVWYYVFRRR